MPVNCEPFPTNFVAWTSAGKDASPFIFHLYRCPVSANPDGVSHAVVPTGMIFIRFIFNTAESIFFRTKKVNLIE